MYRVFKKWWWQIQELTSQLKTRINKLLLKRFLNKSNFTGRCNGGPRIFLRRVRRWNRTGQFRTIYHISSHIVNFYITEYGTSIPPPPHTHMKQIEAFSHNCWNNAIKNVKYFCMRSGRAPPTPPLLIRHWVDAPKHEMAS